MLSHIIISGKLIEYVNYQKDTNYLLPPPGRVRERHAPIERLFGVKRLDNLSRARRDCVRRLFTASALSKQASFITFTFNEANATHSNKVAGTRFAAFQKRLRFKYKDISAVVAVPERHASGRVHIHAMLFGGTFEFERQDRALAGLWGFGTVDVKFHDNSPRALFYVAKYVTKQEGDFEFHSRAYWVSHGIEKPEEFYDETADFLHVKLKGDILSESSKRSVYFGNIIRSKKIRQ